MKMKDFGFYRGVNLGGWFSQCDYSRERLDHFIEEKDIDEIAGQKYRLVLLNKSDLAEKPVTDA